MESNQVGGKEPKEGSPQYREGGVRMNFLEWLNNEHNMTLADFYALPDYEQIKLEEEYKETQL